MALYLPEHNAVFLHIPKVAGTFLRQLLTELTTVRAIAHVHDQLETVRRYNPEVWAKRPFVFCFVRHPASWYRSYWRYRTGDCYKKNWEPFDIGHVTECIDSCGSDDLETFVLNCLKKYPGFVTEFFKSYYKYPEGDEIDFVGRHEFFQADLLSLLRQLRIPHDPISIMARPMANVSTGPVVYLHRDVQALVRHYEAEIVERFYKLR